LTVTIGEETIEMSTLKNKEDQEYSKDLFGGYYRKNFDVFKAPEEQAQQRFNFKIRQLGAGDRSTDDINSGNTSLAYSPSRRTPTHKQALDLNFDSANPSLAVINQKTNAASQQQNQQPLWFNNPKRRTNPSHAIKREAFDELEPESNFLTKTKSNQGSGLGFKSLTFGTRRDNTEMSHVNAFSDELPPSKTIFDLQREDNSDSYLSVNPTNANTSVISQKPIGEDSGIFGASNGTPTFQRSRNILPDHLSKSGNSAFSTPFKQELGKSATQPAVSSPLRTDESAVLVFGYPESIANSVIKHFAKFGTILEDFEATRVDPLFHKQNNKTYPIFTGNGWIKLTYDNRASAIRALEESGTVFHGSMIGCVPYSKQAIENIASISIPTSEDIGETDIALQKNSSIQDENNLLNFTSNSQKISLKNDDKIFVKPKNEKTNLYSSRPSKETNQTNNSMLSKVNNWLFGWEDL
jgi:nucleoporin ASM4